MTLWTLDRHDCLLQPNWLACNLEAIIHVKPARSQTFLLPIVVVFPLCLLLANVFVLAYDIQWNSIKHQQEHVSRLLHPLVECTR